jgi:probable HAF family extracellular repeat protein
MVSFGGSQQSSATGVSADGTVVVGWVNSLPPFPGGNAQAFRWTEATGMVGLGFIPTVGDDFSEARGVSGDGSVVVGNSNEFAFRWTQATGMEPLPGLGGNSNVDRARGVSADGTVIVGSSDSPSSVVEEAFRWTQSTGTVGLGDLPGSLYSSGAEAVSADGSVIVGSSSSGTSSAFIWDADHGMRNLQDLLVNSYGLASSLTGWTLSSATAVSGDGRIIAGHGVNPNGQREAWIASLVPEPASISLLLMGCGFLFKMRRRCLARSY